MKKDKLFTTSQEKQLHNIIKKCTNVVVTEDDYIYERYMEQLSSEF